MGFDPEWRMILRQFDTFCGAIRMILEGSHSRQPAASREVEGPPSRTLGDLLFGTPSPPPAPEREWVALVRAVATGNEEAFRALCGRMHRIVWGFLVGATHDRQTARALTLAVFHDVWRRAPEYRPEAGSVVGWVMDLARRRTRAAGRPAEAHGEAAHVARRRVRVLAELARHQPREIEGAPPIVSSAWQEVGGGISYQVLARDPEPGRIQPIQDRKLGPARLERDRLHVRLAHLHRGHPALASRATSYRSDLSPARTSATKSCGCSQAAKCPPLSSRL